MTECPHCGTRAIIRRSEQITALVREADYRCDNDACGHVFVVAIEVVRTIVPSATPNALIRLPLGNPNLGPKRLPKPANDDTRNPANDTDVPAASAPDPMTS